MGEQTSHQPTSPAQLRELVAWAVAEEQPLEVLGRGTKRGLGRPVEAAHAVSVEAMAGIRLYEPEELVMSAAGGHAAGHDRGRARRAWAGAGVRARRTMARCSAASPAGRPSAACSPATSPARAGSRPGAARDHLLGLHCVTGHGAGDQDRRPGGQERHRLRPVQAADRIYGTLAVLTEVTFKVMPRAETPAPCWPPARESGPAGPAARRDSARPCEISGAAYLPPLAAGRSAVGAVAASGRGRGGDPARGLRALDRLPQRAAAEAAGRPGIDFASLEAGDTATLWREIRDVALLTPEAPALAALGRRPRPPAT